MAKSRPCSTICLLAIAVLAARADAGETIAYRYDALGRLVSATTAGTVNNGLATTIGYDPAGNRQSYSAATGDGPGGAPVVVDGSFENPPQNGEYTYDPVVTGLGFSGNAGIAGNLGFWNFAGGPDGGQFAFLQGGSAPATITLSVSNLIPGATYAVRFQIALHPGYPTLPLAVAFNGSALGTFTAASNAFVPVQTASFTATSTTGTITFTAAGSIDASLAIDAVSVVAAPAVPDFSFESPPQNGAWTFTPTVSGVTFTGRTGIQANGSAWGFATAPDGIQTGILQSYGGAGGSIAFTVSGLTPGASYRAGFSIAQRPNYGVATVSVTFNGNAAGSVTPASTAFAPVTSASFTASATTGTLTFSVPAGSGDSSAAIDAVGVAAGP